MMNDAESRYHELTKYSRDKLSRAAPPISARPEPFKSYPEAKTFPLSMPGKFEAGSLWDALRVRRSVRSYAAAGLSQRELSLLLWAAQGVTQRFRRLALRTAPSAGALYPIETYVSVQNVEEVPDGIYHYGVLNHALELLKPGDQGEALASAALDQGFIASAAAVFIWTAVFGRSAWKYGQRAFRYIYLDAGHIAQNAALAAAALGLGTCQIGALYDDEVNALVGVDGQVESVVYMTSIGRIRG